MSFNVGENVGPYRIIEQLGQGGMATVYKAYHASLDRYVALKVLHPAFNQDQSFTLRFQREARVVARLEHTNIVPIYDYAEHEGRPFLVMKYIEGDTLKAHLNQGPLTAEEIERVVNSVGYALAYAHRQGILHRDIKPSNVMIAKDGTMYLADFGLARIAEAGESTLSSDSIMGTPQYISPEQAMGKKDLDAGTDIYSFGVMLYEMVVGRVPFTADTPFSIIHDHIYTPLPLPMTVNPNVPESVQRVLLKALAKDRADRYATIEEMIKAFKDAWTEAGVPMQGTAIVMRSATVKSEKPKTEEQQPVTPEKQPSTQTPAPVKKKQPWKWIGIGVGISLICCCVFAFAVARNGDRGKNPEPPTTPVFAPTIAPLMPIATQLVAPPPATLPPPPPTWDSHQPTNLPPSATEGTSPEVQAAMDAVKKNPRDADAHLQLALALWDAKQTPAAFDEVQQAANLVDQNNPDFFIHAADQCKQREAWGLAALMYMRLTVIYRNSGGMNPDTRQNLREAVYKAAGADLPPTIQFDRLDNFDQAFANIIRGRRALYNNNLDEANRQLRQAQKQKPDMPETLLLQAEITLKMGDAKAAKVLFAALARNNSAPEWVRGMATDFINTLQ